MRRDGVPDQLVTLEDAAQEDGAVWERLTSRTFPDGYHTIFVAVDDAALLGARVRSSQRGREVTVRAEAAIVVEQGGASVHLPVFISPKRVFISQDSGTSKKRKKMKT